VAVEVVAEVITAAIANHAGDHLSRGVSHVVNCSPWRPALRVREPRRSIAVVASQKGLWKLLELDLRRVKSHPLRSFQAQREGATKVCAAEQEFLGATDIAARGLDVDSVTCRNLAPKRCSLVRPRLGR